MIHVAILDDHPVVLAGLRRLIDAQPDLVVVAAAPTVPALAAALGGARADLLIVDYDLARGDGLAHCRRIKSRRRPPAVLIYSAYAGAALTLAARAAQADGVVNKAEPVSALLTAIRRVGDGETVLPAVPRAAYEAAAERVDDTDLPVLAMLLDGEPLDAIADALRTDEPEIAWRAQRIVGRLRPRIRTQADVRRRPGDLEPLARWESEGGAIGDGSAPVEHPRPRRRPERPRSPVRLAEAEAGAPRERPHLQLPQAHDPGMRSSASCPPSRLYVKSG